MTNQDLKSDIMEVLRDYADADEVTLLEVAETLSEVTTVFIATMKEEYEEELE